MDESQGEECIAMSPGCNVATMDLAQNIRQELKIYRGGTKVVP